MKPVGLDGKGEIFSLGLGYSAGEGGRALHYAVGKHHYFRRSPAPDMVVLHILQHEKYCACLFGILVRAAVRIDREG